MTANRVALTDILIQKLRAPESGQVEVFDARAPGLSLRCGTSGAKVFYLTYRLSRQRKRRRGKLGVYPMLTLGGARAARIAKLTEIAKGIDPFAEERRPDDPSKFAFDACVERFIEKYVKHRNKRPDEAIRILRNEFVSMWGSRDIRGIEWSDVEAVLLGIGTRGAPVAANRAFTRIRKFFNWVIATADRKDRLPYSPCDRQKTLFQEESRDRVLKDGELAALWNSADACGYPYGPLFKLWVLLGQRRSEVAGMRWEHLDLGEALWEMPSRSTKNNEPHVLPLPKQAVRIIKACPRIGNSAFVFPSGRDANKHLTGYAVMKRELDDLSGVKGWTNHDARRTQATCMAKLGVSETIIERIQNHKLPRTGVSQVAKVYNRYAYLREMRAALEKWAAYVEKNVMRTVRPPIVRPTKVRRYHRDVARIPAE